MFVVIVINDEIWPGSAENGFREGYMTEKWVITKQCPTCGAYLSKLNDGRLRCPWANTSHGYTIEIEGITIVACDWPYSGERQRTEIAMQPRKGN